MITWLYLQLFVLHNKLFFTIATGEILVNSRVVSSMINSYSAVKVTRVKLTGSYSGIIMPVDEAFLKIVLLQTRNI